MFKSDKKYHKLILNRYWVISNRLRGWATFWYTLCRWCCATEEINEDSI